MHPKSQAVRKAVYLIHTPYEGTRTDSLEMQRQLIYLLGIQAGCFEGVYALPDEFYAPRGSLARREAKKWIRQREPKRKDSLENQLTTMRHDN